MEKIQIVVTYNDACHVMAWPQGASPRRFKIEADRPRVRVETAIPVQPLKAFNSPAK